MHSVLSDMTESFCDGDELKYYSVPGTVMFRTRHAVHCKEIQHTSLKMYFVLVCFHPLLLCECLQLVHYSAAVGGQGTGGSA